MNGDMLVRAEIAYFGSLFLLSDNFVLLRRFITMLRILDIGSLL